MCFSDLVNQKRWPQDHELRNWKLSLSWHRGRAFAPQTVGDHSYWEVQGQQSGVRVPGWAQWSGLQGVGPSCFLYRLGAGALPSCLLTPSPKVMPRSLDPCPVSGKELISRICKELLQLNNKRTTQFKKWAKYLNRHLAKEDIQMANKHKKRCSISLVIWKMQMKTTVSLAQYIYWKGYNPKCWWGHGETRTLICCWHNIKYCNRFEKQFNSFFKDLNMKLPYKPAIHLGYLLKTNTCPCKCL